MPALPGCSDKVSDEVSDKGDVRDQRGCPNLRGTPSNLPARIREKSFPSSTPRKINNALQHPHPNTRSVHLNALGGIQKAATAKQREGLRAYQCGPGARQTQPQTARGNHV